MGLFRSIRLTTLLAVLVCFAFPWLDVSCSQKSVIQQNGFQMIYGGSSLGAEMHDLEEQLSVWGEEDEIDRREGNSIDAALFVLLAFFDVLLCVALAVAAIMSGKKDADALVTVLSLAAFGLLVAQFVEGFPLFRDVAEVRIAGLDGDAGGGRAYGRILPAFLVAVVLLLLVPIQHLILILRQGPPSPNPQPPQPGEDLIPEPRPTTRLDG